MHTNTQRRQHPYAVFVKCSTALVPYLGHLYRATFALAIYPSGVEGLADSSSTKPGKPRFTAPGAYRPIAPHPYYQQDLVFMYC